MLKPMMRVWQAMMWSFFLSLMVQAEEKKTFEFKSPVVGSGVFSDKLGMLDKEREEYAVNLANYAGNQIAIAKGSAESLSQARRLLALSLHLSSRNRKAVVMCYQLQRGILPEKVEGDYGPEVLARLLLTRGQLLEKQGQEEDVLLGHCFVEIAAEMDPKNEDAVYASEVLRMDRKKVSWDLLTDVKPDAKIPSENQPAKDQPQP